MGNAQAQRLSSSVEGDRIGLYAPSNADARAIVMVQEYGQQEVAGSDALQFDNSELVTVQFAQHVRLPAHKKYTIIACFEGQEVKSDISGVGRVEEQDLFSEQRATQDMLLQCSVHLQ